MTLLHQAAQKALEALATPDRGWSIDAAFRAIRSARELLESALQQQPEPVALIGWLYDWTHSSALGKPDEQFTGFTTDEAHARKHDNPRAVYTAPALQHQDVPREPVALTDKQIQDAVFAVLRKWNTDRAWERYTRESGPYDVSSLRPEVLEIIRAVLAASPSTTRQQEVGSGLLDNETFRKGIREDGTVEGHFVETYYLPCKAIGDDDGFLRVVVDDNATDAETRVPHSALISSGWVRAAAPSTPENAAGVRVAPAPLPIKELLAIYDAKRGDWCAIVREVERRHGIGKAGVKGRAMHPDCTADCDCEPGIECAARGAARGVEWLQCHRCGMPWNRSAEPLGHACGVGGNDGF